MWFQKNNISSIQIVLRWIGNILKQKPLIGGISVSSPSTLVGLLPIISVISVAIHASGLVPSTPGLARELTERVTLSECFLSSMQVVLGRGIFSLNLPPEFQPSGTRINLGARRKQWVHTAPTNHQCKGSTDYWPPKGGTDHHRGSLTTALKGIDHHRWELKMHWGAL